MRMGETLPERRKKLLREAGGYFDATGTTIIGSVGTNHCGERIVMFQVKFPASRRDHCRLTAVGIDLVYNAVPECVGNVAK